MGMHIDARPRFQLLEKAIASPSEPIVSDTQQYEILVEKDKDNNVKHVAFKYKGGMITEYSPDKGITMHAPFITCLTENMKDIMAIGKAIEDDLIKADGPPIINVVQSSSEPPSDTIIDDSWTIIDDPTKVKHKSDTHGKPLLSIPIRRPDAQKSGIDTESWLVFAFKEIKRPDDAKRPGGYGRGCPK